MVELDVEHWVLSFWIGINDLSACTIILLTPWVQWYMLDKNWGKIGSSKDFLKNFFLFVCILKGASAEEKTEDI